MEPIEGDYSMWDNAFDMQEEETVLDNVPALQHATYSTPSAMKNEERVTMLNLNAGFLPLVGNLFVKLRKQHLKRETKRMRALAAVIQNANYDVVCLQEMWSTRIRKRLLALLEAESYTVNGSNPCAENKAGKRIAHYYSLSPDEVLRKRDVGSSSGLLVLSKFPIVNAKVQAFNAKAMGTDYFSKKGILYVELNVNGQPLHVATTHMQASPDPFPLWWPFMVKGNAKQRAKQVRLRQLEETKRVILQIAEMIAENGKERTNLIFCGDLNIKRESEEYFHLMDTLSHPVDVLSSFNKDAMDEHGNSVMFGKLDYIFAWDKFCPIFDNRIMFEKAEFVKFEDKFSDLITFPVSDHPAVEASFKIIPRENIISKAKATTTAPAATTTSNVTQPGNSCK